MAKTAGSIELSKGQTMSAQITPSNLPDLETLLNAFPKEFVEISPKAQGVAIALYRLLALGKPVTHQQLADASEMTVSEVDELLCDWLGVYHDSDGRVSGFLGLATGETPHKILIDGREVFAWCAWDTLFLPALIGHGAQVISHCAQSGKKYSSPLEPATSRRLRRRARCCRL